MILSIDLYHCIVNPLTYHRRMTPSKTIRFIIYSWILSLLAATLPLVGWGSCWAYYHIVKAAKRQARILPINNVPFRGSISSTLSGNFTGSKAFRITILVLGSVTICWGTYIVTILLESSKVNTPTELQVTITILNSLMTFIYPMIYGIRIKKTRRRIRKLFISMCICGHDNNVRPVTSSDAGFFINSTRAFRNRSVSDGSVLDFEGARDLTTGWCLPAIVEETDESHLRVFTEVTDLDRVQSIPGQISE
ncbi:hypothetical protein AC249_AIPGENE20808 [Exaiptasia diaphana]|nr:hypothetical protein AC249_AIPGENE20808 [Exaiptasia diaphana]